MKKKFYSKEFKDRAVQQSYQRDNIKELADELGISPERIYKWRTDYRGSGSSSITEKTQEHLEIKKLKKALKEKELELEILKKAVHIFSKSDGNSMNS